MVQLSGSGPAAGAAETVVVNTGIIVGDVVLGDSHYRLRPLETGRPAAPSGRSPSQLLAARHQVVDFTGRESELSSLRLWRDDTAQQRSALLLHGPGGQGKTRLAMEFARDCDAVGWRVLTLDREPAGVRSVAAPFADPGPVGHGLLIVVDYAERWPAGHLPELLAANRLPGSGPVRVLLLARPAGRWWHGLRHELRKRDVAVDELRLGALPDDVDARRHVFASAVRGFAAVLPGADPAEVAPPKLDDEAFGLVLTVHMAALAALDAGRDPRLGRPTGDPAALSAYLLDREEAHWQAMRAARIVDTSPQVMARTVYLATLTRSIEPEPAVAALTRTGVVDAGQSVGVILDDHATCYPPTDAERVLEPLYPDRLGEDFLALQIPGHDVAPYPPAAWAVPLIRRLVDADDGEAYPPWAGAAIGILVESARRWPHLARQVLSPLLREHPKLLLAAGGIVLSRLVEIDAVAVDALAALEAVVPAGRDVHLDPGIALLFRRLHEHRLAQAADEVQRARIEAGYGWRLANAGLRQEALEATERAVVALRRLAVDGDVAVRADLARQLIRYAMRLRMLGRSGNALDAAREARKVARYLVTVGTPDAELLLVEALDGLGLCQGDRGRTAAARASAEAAYQLLCEVDDRPGADHRRLRGQVANNLSLARFACGAHREALAAVYEAVELRRALAGENPVAFEPELGQSLCNEGRYLTELGQYWRAYEAIDAAVRVLRRSSTTNPVYEHELAAALGNLGTCLWAMGRRVDALAAAGQARAIYERLSVDNPAGFGPELRRAVENIQRMRTFAADPPPHRWGLQAFNS